MSYPEVVFGKYTYECCQHCCRGWRGGGSACQCSDHMPHTASNWSAWHPRRKPLLKMMHKKAHKQFAEDKQTKGMGYWIHVLWSAETKINFIWFRWCQTCVAATRWGVQRQACLAYGQAWWWECHGLGLYECCRHWGATVHWGNHEYQHILWLGLSRFVVTSRFF